MVCFKSFASYCTVVACWVLLARCALAGDDGATSVPENTAQADESGLRVEIPWIRGAFRHVLDPPGMM